MAPPTGACSTWRSTPTSQKLAGLPGTTFRVNAYQIQGRNLSAENILNYSTISGLAARPTTRLFELWIEQKLFADMASVRVGQLTADNQFFISEFGNSLFINVTFGWSNLFIQDLPGGGGPNYPLATPGARLKVTPTDQITLLAAIFNGDPAGTGFTGLQEIKDPAGINFRLKDPPFLIGEAQYKYNQEKDFRRSCWDDQVWRMVSLRPVQRQSFRDRRQIARRSVEQWTAARPSRQFWCLWRDRSDALALARRGSKKRHWRICAYRGKPFGSQSDELLCGGRNQFHGDLEATAG